MKFRFIIDAECERTEGKFAGREEIEEQFISELEGAQPDLSGLENGGSYEVSDFNVTADDPDNISVDPKQWNALQALAREALALHNTAVRYPKLGVLNSDTQKIFAKHLRKVPGFIVADRAYAKRADADRRNSERREGAQRVYEAEAQPAGKRVADRRVIIRRRG